MSEPTFTHDVFLSHSANRGPSGHEDDQCMSQLKKAYRESRAAGGAAMKTDQPQIAFSACVKETPLKTGKLPQIFRRLEAIGYTQRSDGGYLNSNAEANIQTITWGHDRIEDNCVWLMVTARKPFAYITEASQRFAQRRQFELLQRLELRKKYWLRTIQPHIKDRALRGVELYVATDAHSRLRDAAGRAARWNHTEHGQHWPVPAAAQPDFGKDLFLEPEELCRGEKLTPELLAAIAAPMIPKRKARLTPLAVVIVAHDLLRAAHQYVNALPGQKRGEARIIEDLQTAFSTVTFAEIEACNRRSSGQLPLLPPVGRKQEAETDPKQEVKTERKLRGQPLSKAAIRAAVKRFIYEQKPRLKKEEYMQKENYPNPAIARLMAEQQWESDNADLIDCQRNSRVSVQSLCQLRWERFAKAWEIRQRAVLTREKKRREERQEEPSSSVTASPKVAGKANSPHRESAQ